MVFRRSGATPLSFMIAGRVGNPPLWGSAIPAKARDFLLPGRPVGHLFGPLSGGEPIADRDQHSGAQVGYRTCAANRHHQARHCGVIRKLKDTDKIKLAEAVVEGDDLPTHSLGQRFNHAGSVFGAGHQAG